MCRRFWNPDSLASNGVSAVGREQAYLKLVTDAVAVCKAYRPKLGHGGKGYTQKEFQAFYAADPFYSWIGLNSPLMYAALKASGGMTSVYRQVGIGCERLFRRLLRDHLGLTPEESTWSYDLPPDERGRTRRLTLDGRIPSGAVSDVARREIVDDWIARVGHELRIDTASMEHKLGAVFEVRQGYKSKDSKRQNADIANASNAHAHDYLPVIAVFSMQMDEDLIKRYRENRILVLTGNLGDADVSSTYAFCRNVIGYDLAAFFEEHTEAIKQQVGEVLEAPLSPQ